MTIRTQVPRKTKRRGKASALETQVPRKSKRPGNASAPPAEAGGALRYIKR